MAGKIENNFLCSKSLGRHDGAGPHGEDCLLLGKISGICSRLVRGNNLSKLKGQSHGDFPLFFVTSLINLYQSTLLIHELLLDHKGTILNEFSKKKQAKISF